MNTNCYYSLQSTISLKDDIQYILKRAALNCKCTCNNIISIEESN